MMGKARNLARLIVDSSGDVDSSALSNVPASNDASALSTGTLPIARIADAAVTAAKLATEAKPIGVGQTWQNVTGSRALNTTYTNTTGRPIVVAVTFQSTSGAYDGGGLTIDGIEIQFSASDSTWGGGSTSATGIVPSGSTYSATPMQTSLRSWRELR